MPFGEGAGPSPAGRCAHEMATHALLPWLVGRLFSMTHQTEGPRRRKGIDECIAVTTGAAATAVCVEAVRRKWQISMAGATLAIGTVMLFMAARAAARDAELRTRCVARPACHGCVDAVLEDEAAPDRRVTRRHGERRHHDARLGGWARVTMFAVVTTRRVMVAAVALGARRRHGVRAGEDGMTLCTRDVPVRNVIADRFMTGGAGDITVRSVRERPATRSCRGRHVRRARQRGGALRGGDGVGLARPVRAPATGRRTRPCKPDTRGSERAAAEQCRGANASPHGGGEPRLHLLRGRTPEPSAVQRREPPPRVPGPRILSRDRPRSGSRP